MENKLATLEKIITSQKSLAVAFSGGTDSAFLLYEAKHLLGKEVVALYANLNSTTNEELVFAKKFCLNLEVQLFVLDIDELSVEGFKNNPPDRCFHCKREIFSKLKEKAKALGINHVAEGSNADDVSDYRPGMKAVKELSILSPLLEAGLTKEEIRTLSKKADLITWDKPSSPCLASRIPYGETITYDKLRRIEKGEAFLKKLGFTTLRVRNHENLARIEVAPEDQEKVLSKAPEINAYFKALGFAYVSLDLSAFKSGRLNEVL